MNVRVLLARTAGALVLAALGATLLAHSSLVALLPIPPAWLALAGVVLVALVPSLVTRSTPLPATLAVLFPILAVGAYGQSNLDWLRLLKDFGVTEPGSPSPLRLALGLAAIATAWATHVVDHGLRLHARAIARGLEPREARAASHVVWRAGARRAGEALTATGILVVVVLVAMRLPLDILLGGRAALLAPLLAAVLVAAAAILLVRKPTEET